MTTIIPSPLPIPPVDNASQRYNSAAAQAATSSPDQVNGLNNTRPSTATTALQTPQGLNARPDEKQVLSAVNKINDYLKQQGNQVVSFQIDKDTGFSVVQIKDINTNKVLRQIPSKETLEIAKELGKHTGTLLKTSA